MSHSKKEMSKKKKKDCPMGMMKDHKEGKMAPMMKEKMHKKAARGK